jgi:protocatechuate 3,4-dioxygenase beta subunit
MKPCITILLLLALLSTALSPTLVSAEQPAAIHQCQPTEEDEMGPFYRPGAPLRTKIGSGYLLSGTVRSTANCAAIPSPLIEFWQAGPNSRYGDAYRAAIITDHSGRYHFETDAPPAYVTRPPHIHIRVSAAGFKTLVTQHYLQSGVSAAEVDLVLETEK